MLHSIRQHRAFTYTLFLVFQFISYPLISNLSQKYSFNLWSPEWIVDYYIPFIPFAAIPYFFYTPLLVTPLFLLRHKEHFNLLAAQLFAASLINYAFSFIIDNQISSRVSTFESESTFLFLTSYLYKIDADSCLFPSIHATHSLLICSFLWKIKHKLKGVIFIIAFSTSISTVLVKQHFLLDFVSGVLLFVVIFYASVYYFSECFNKTQNIK